MKYLSMDTRGLMDFLRTLDTKDDRHRSEYLILSMKPSTSNKFECEGNSDGNGILGKVTHKKKKSRLRGKNP